MIEVRTATSVTRDGETRFLDTAGQRVRYRVRGDGPPLLMINGLGGPLELWGPLVSKLGDFRTITVDAPGAGGSSTPREHFGMRQFAQVMDDLLTHLELDSANVLGLSLGGMMAQELAHLRPERVEKLVLASTTCGWLRNAAAVIANLARSGSRGYHQPVASSGYDAGIDRSPSLLGLEWELPRYRPTVRGLRVQSRAARYWSSHGWLGELDMPVLVIAGSDDRLVSVAHCRRIASNVRDGRLEIIPGGGHLCLIRESSRTSELVRQFLLDR